jgi:enoyl-CoA hydratase/carnithine racemase
VSDDRVRVRIADNGVATATMVRADKHNALDQAMCEGLWMPPSSWQVIRRLRLRASQFCKPG